MANVREEFQTYSGDSSFFVKLYAVSESRILVQGVRSPAEVRGGGRLPKKASTGVELSYDHRVQ